MSYQLVKNLHIVCVYLTLLSFSGRIILRFFYPVLLKLKVIKVLPHIIDTVLLISAIYLASYWMNSLQMWLVVKIALLIVYILLGHKALSTRQSIAESIAYSVFALVTFIVIIGVAITKSSIGWLSFWI